MAELLYVPLKKSSDVDIVKPLKNLIQSSYNADKETEDYSEALNELSRLRTNAIWKVFEKSSLDVLYNYYDQLSALEQKIPPQEVQIPFKWKDAFDKGSLFGGRMSLTVSSLAFERVCVMFNMAATQSSLAAQEPLDTEDSLKLAAKLLQQSAGIFGYLKANVLLAVHQEPTPDLAPDTLHALAATMLAQAQEVIAYKCIRDEMKESMVAKVCAQCEELYTDALRALQKDALRVLWDRTWIPAVMAKQAAFRGLAQLYQALVCHAAKAVGEEIARLQIAAEQLKLASSAVPVAALREAAARAARALAAAQRDNDFIYHERVPDARQLEPVPRAPVAQPLAPAARWAPQRPDLFERLVPLAVRQAEAASAGRLRERGGAAAGRLRGATQLLHAALGALGLPAAASAGGPDAAPDSLRAAAAAARRAGGRAALTDLLHQLPALTDRNQEILTETERMLREEEEADSALRAQFGAGWARTPSAALTAALRANADKYRQILDNARRADTIVRDKYAAHEEGIEALCGSESELDARVPPASRRADPAALAALRALMAEVEQLKAEREELEAALRDVSVDLRGAFSRALAEGGGGGALDEPAISAAALDDALAPLLRRVEESLTKQESLMSRVQEAHAALHGDGAGGPGGAGEDRDAALRKLQAAADAYQELTANLQEATKFYNDLTQLLVAFQNKVSDFCFARRTEKEELLKDLTQQASRPPPAAEPAVVRREAPPRPPPPAPAASAPGPAPAAPAPVSQLPYPTQPQGMPLPYGAVAAPFPYYAALPAGYHPYATLPYPHHAPRAPHPAPHAPPPAAPYQPAQYPGYSPYHQPPPQ